MASTFDFPVVRAAPAERRFQSPAIEAAIAEFKANSTARTLPIAFRCPQVVTRCGCTSGKSSGPGPASAWKTLTSTARVLSNFSVAAVAGENKALVREFPDIAPDAKGEIVVRVAAAPGSPDQNAKISAIEIFKP